MQHACGDIALRQRAEQLACINERDGAACELADCLCQQVAKRRLPCRSSGSMRSQMATVSSRASRPRCNGSLPPEQ